MSVTSKPVWRDMRAIVYDRMVALRNLTLLNDEGDMEKI
jgi:hypothetical protein